MRLVSEAASRVSDNSFKRKYITIGRIVNNWSEIIGEKFAAKAYPVKIFYRKHKKTSKHKKDTSPVATLQVAVSSADATLLHYQKDIILQRINHIFGEAWITDIKFIHAPNDSRRRPSRRKKTIKKTRPLCPEEENNLSDMLSHFSDHDIKQKLLTLGQAVLTQQ